MENYKIIFRNIKAAIAPLFLCLMTFGSNAQTLVNPSASPSSLVTGLSNAITGLNTAMIQGSNTGSGNVTLLFATVYLDAAGGSSLVYNDLVSGTIGSVALSHTPTSTPDVIICNSQYSPDLYTIVVAYPSGAHVYVDYYTFYDYGTAAAWSGPTLTATTSNHVGWQPTTVHLDGIVDFGNTSYTGFPFTSLFVVVWDDSLGSIYAAFANADNPPPHLSATTISSSYFPSGIFSWYPDVAAIERSVSLNQDHIALITFLDGAHQNLYYIEWDVNTNTVSSPTVIETTTAYLALPRIDAIDDFNHNTPSMSFGSWYKVAVEYDGSSGWEVHTDDNQGTWNPSTVINFGALTPPYNNYAPTIALGGPAPSGPAPLNFDGTQYMVTQYTDNGGGGDIVMMEPIDYGVGNYNSLASPNDYFWVSQNPGTSSSGYYASCVSSDCNNISGSGLVAWALYNSGTSSYDIWYKITGYSPYAFRHSHQTVTNTTSAKPLSVYPNPACNFLAIENAGSSDTYSITDIAGSTVMMGVLQSSNQTISVNQLTPGDYTLKIHELGGKYKTEKFVKE